MSIQARQLVNWLAEQNIQVPEAWVEACQEWLREEHAGAEAGFNHSRWCIMVREQWMFADLRQLGVPVVPAPMVSEAKYRFTGKMHLQVNRVSNVSNSFYGQLRQLEGTENANTLVSADTTTQADTTMGSFGTQRSGTATGGQRSSQSGNQVLLLEMTDGVQDVRGLECQSLGESISIETLSPGCKVLLVGPILCRRGVLLLRTGNLQHVGGEVDQLVEENSPMNALRHSLASNLSLDTASGQPLPAWYTSATQSSNHQQALDGPAVNTVQPQRNTNTTVEASQEVIQQQPTRHQRNNTIEDDHAQLTMRQNVPNLPATVAAPRAALIEPTSWLKPSGITRHVTSSAATRPVDGAPQFTSTQRMAGGGSAVLWSSDEEEGGEMATRSRPEHLPPDRLEDDFEDDVLFSQAVNAIEGIEADTRPNNQSEELPTPPPKRRRSSPPVSIGQTSFATAGSSTALSSSGRSDRVPMCYIQDMYTVIMQLDFTGPTVFLVRGFVLGVTGRLAHNNGAFWSLPIKLTDGTCNLEVNMTSPLLSRLIELSPSEWLALRSTTSDDSTSAMSRRLDRFQAWLSDFSGIFHVEVDARRERPQVIYIEEIDDAFVLAMVGRLRRWESKNVSREL